MSAKKAATGAAADRVAKGIPIADVLKGIKEVADCVREIAKQKTEQARIDSEARVEIERVRGVKEVLMSYLDASFAERRQNFDALFLRLDRALESDNLAAASATLSALVQLADSSPFKALHDVQATGKLLKEKKKEWEL